MGRWAKNPREIATIVSRLRKVSKEVAQSELYPSRRQQIDLPAVISDFVDLGHEIMYQDDIEDEDEEQPDLSAPPVWMAACAPPRLEAESTGDELAPEPEPEPESNVDVTRIKEEPAEMGADGMVTDGDAAQGEQVEGSSTPAETEVSQEVSSRPLRQARYTGSYNQSRKYTKSKGAGLTFERYAPRE